MSETSWDQPVLVEDSAEDDSSEQYELRKHISKHRLNVTHGDDNMMEVICVSDTDSDTAMRDHLVTPQPKSSWFKCSPYKALDSRKPRFCSSEQSNEEASSLGLNQLKTSKSTTRPRTAVKVASKASKKETLNINKRVDATGYQHFQSSDVICIDFDLEDEDKIAKSRTVKPLSKVKHKESCHNKHYCKFCGAYIDDLSHHFVRYHSTETEVRALLSLSPKSQGKRLALQRLIDDGLQLAVTARADTKRSEQNKQARSAQSKC
jgi:hypothetical protein